MPGGHTCTRCKQVLAIEGDLWCGACSAWESIGRELSVSWDQPGCRVIASDLILNCARQIRALRSLGAGIARASSDVASAGTGGKSRRGEEGRHQEVEVREPLERKRKAPPPPIKREASEDDQDDLLEEEESEEEELYPLLITRL